MSEELRKLFVAGLADSINEDVLRQLFEATGATVVDVSLPKDRMTGRPRGFGFVTLGTPEEANQARSMLDGSYQAGKPISVRPAQKDPPRREAGGGGGRPPMGGPREPRREGGNFSGGGGGGAKSDRTIYVGNLPYDATSEEIQSIISGAGVSPAVNIHLPTDPDGRKRGFGFVEMSSNEAALAAIEALKVADVRSRKLIVNIAHPKGERPPREERSFGGGGYGGGGGGYGGGGGGGGYGGGFAPPPPAQPRKTFDERRKKGGSHHDEDGGGGRRNKNWDRRNRDDDDDDYSYDD